MSVSQVILLFSGGLDSTYALFKLREEGYKVLPLVLMLSDNVPSPIQKERIESVLSHFNLKPLYYDAREIFSKKVMEYFINEYRQGRTPNPCAVCNAMIKFEIANKIAQELGIERISSGHYASIEIFLNRHVLAKARDNTKSQEYFLARVKPELLTKLLFPLSRSLKKEAYQFWQENFRSIPLPAESQDICFLANTTHREFLKDRGLTLKGRAIYKGNVVKQEIELIGLTRGQRKGLDIAVGKRVYVLSINPAQRTVYLGERDRLYVKRFSIKAPIFYIPVSSIEKCEVRVRYSKQAIECKLLDSSTIELLTPSILPVPGQLAVGYINKYVIFSGWIDQILR